MPLTRRLILQKARHHTLEGALTDCKRMVSGTLSLPSRGTFHHSLTVLSTIGHTEYLGLPGGPGRFTADSTSPLLLGQHTNCTHKCFTYRTLTVYGRTFQSTSATPTHTQRRTSRPCNNASPQPHARKPCQVSHARGLASSTFVRHY